MDRDPGYWAAAPAAPGPVGGAVVPVTPAPTAHRARRLALACAAVVLLAATAVSVVAARVEALPELRQVTTPATAEQGWAPSWVDDRGRPARWDPCHPVHYVVNPAWAPAQGGADVAEALRRLTDVTGLTFVSDGSTDEVPARDRPAYQPGRYGDRWAPVLIAWVPPAVTDLGLGDGVQGLTSTVAVPTRDGGALVTAQVALDADHRLSPGFGPGATEGEVLLHELAHAVGLGHVDDPTQVMYYRTTNSESAFGAGDRAGLSALGAAAGCRPAPQARPLQTG